MTEELDPAPGPSSSHGDRDQRLGNLVTEYMDRLNEGERLCAEDILSAHPDLGKEILEQLRLFVELDSRLRDDGEPLGVIGDYTLRRQIGRGGMGVVYEAWESSMDRRVALKVLPAGIAADDKAVTRFVREARLAGKLSHPSVVGVYGMGVKEQTPYYAMEFVEGETLAQVLTRLREARPEAETVFGNKDCAGYFESIARAFADVADGLQHAHSKGVVHRDIKPSNLILDNEGRLRILDFGLARLEGQESLTISGDIVGTPFYMSPEQARRKKIPMDHRTDVYSLGATLYEMLTLRPPFRGNDHQDTLSQIIERDPVEPRKVNSRVPKDFETIVLKCLRKEAGDRYGTAEALGQDLRRFVRADPIEARPQSGWERAARRAWRYRWRLIAGGFAFVLLLTVGWLAVRSHGLARLRDIDAYGPDVLAALVKLQAGSLSRRAASGQFLVIDSNRELFGKSEDLMPDPGMEPFEEAAKELRKAAQVLPDKPDAHYHLARCQLFLGEFAEALKSAETAGGVAPSFVPALVLRAAVYESQGEPHFAGDLERKAESAAGSGWQRAWLAAYRATREKRWEEAEGGYGDLIALERSGSDPYLGCGLESRLGRAAARIERRDYVGALRDIEVAQDRWPDSVEPVLLEGKACYLMGEKDKAERIFQACFDRARFQDEIALAVLAIYFGSLDMEKALSWTHRMANEALRERARADVHMYTGDYEKAAAAAKRALDLYPKDPSGYRILAIILYDGPGLFEEANGHLETALALHPDDPWTHFHLGRMRRMWGKPEDAAKSYRRALELKPVFAIAEGDLGFCLLAQGKTAEALSCFESAARKEPLDAEVQNNFAVGLLHAGRLQESMERCDEAIRLSAGYSWPHRYRGNALERLGRLEEAEEEYRKALPLIPREAYSNLDLGRLLERQGRLEEAFSRYCDAVEIEPRIEALLGRIVALLGKEEFQPLPGDLDRLIARLERAAQRPEAEPGCLNTLALLLLETPARKNTGRAFELALRAVEATRHGYQTTFVETLDRVLHELEANTPSSGRRLELLPGLPPYEAMDTILDGDREPDSAKDRRLLEKFRTAGPGDGGSPARLAYLEGKVLERAGKHVEAAERFARAAAKDPARPEPHLRRAESLRAAGEPAMALSGLRSALLEGVADDRRLWEMWAGVSFVDLKRSPQELLADLPEPVPGEPHHSDLKWLLERLAAGDSIRIRCGGDGYTGANGMEWRRDGFFAGGKTSWPVGLEIAGTDDDPLYQGERWFPEGSSRKAGYRVPLPPGSYRVTLCFAEAFWHVPRARVFDIVAEGETVHEGYEPFSGGFATADRRAFEVEVIDGLLEIELVRRADNPKVSAIEIQPIR